MGKRARYTPGVWLALVRYPGRVAPVEAVCTTEEILATVKASADVVAVCEVGAGGLAGFWFAQVSKC